MKRILCGWILTLLAGSAMAELAIKDIRVYPKPLRFKGTQAPHAIFDITVAPHSNLPDFNGCVLAFDFGDGVYAPNFNFPAAGTRRASYNHVYEKPGTYTAIAFGAPGSRGCSGVQRLTVVVEPSDDGAAQTDTAQVSCPSGWTMVPGSQQGSRFNCHVNPPAQPIACANGTKYFETPQGLIGCR